MLSNYSVKKPYTVVVGVIIVALLGVVSLMNMTTDLLPSLNLPYAVISTTYIGASPEEVETVVTRPIEQAMASLNNLKNISSISRENMSLVILEFTASANMDSAFVEMRESLDMIMAYMPDGVGNPIMLKLNPDMMPIMVLSVAMEGMEIGESSQFVSDNIIHEFESIEGVASVSASGLVESGIHIILRDEKIEEVNQNLANFFRMTVPHMPAPNISINREMVSGILKGQNFSMPAGYITEDGVSYLVRTGDAIKDIDELKNLPIITLPFPNLEPITLQDVAEIIVTDNSDTMYTKLNGNNAVILNIQKQSEYSTADVANRVRERIAVLANRYQGLDIVPLMDQGIYVDMVVSSISNNLIFGGILAVAILLLFLRDIRPTIVVGFAIPVSLVTALVMMYFSNVTLNIISMGGLALGVGMLVDNSIVVIENIYRMRSEGKSPKEAAVEGAVEVSGAIMASTLTTVSVFAPILFTQGITRQLFTDMGLTIAYSLFASLIIALTLVPMMASNIIVKEVNRENKVLDKVKGIYTNILEFSLRKKWLVIILVTVLFVTSIVSAFSLGTEFFPATDTGQIMVDITMPEGSSFKDTVNIADEVMEIVKDIPYVAHVGGTIGGRMGFGFMGGRRSGDNALIYVLVDEENINKTPEIIREIREKVKDIPAEISVRDSGSDMSAMTGGRGIAISVMGRDFHILENIAKDIAQIVESVEGTTEVFDGIDRTEPEIRVVVDKEKSIAYGLTVAQVFMEINNLLRSPGVDTTITIGNIDYGIRVKDEKATKGITREELENLVIKGPNGEVPLKDIAKIEDGWGYGSIRRENSQRLLTVTAELEEGYNIGLVNREISRKLSDYQLPEGYRIKVGGEQEAIDNAFRDLFFMLALAVALIYLIMVAQFQSLLSPFIVMFTIPLAFTGGFFALRVTGNPVSIVAFIGLIILSGVVVNNGIVFIDYINILRRRGLTKRDAIITAGNVRLRPIIMTALTTIIALSTMSVGMGTGTEMIQPMAITAIGGLIYATLLTLIFIPVLYDIFNRKEYKKDVA
ncbi:efflux RND transporter permease subunit [Anaerobranca gottschalkii]|uniref:Hydrophobic/amphiphilic exporter-1, HAE1 family n=1 Tax=Anaerobranca gottschalkii DSM 13577 TaxID=1120990 RepID=A0A1I0AM38_9FIRM|nr:efflux RND transporter permease subunit [Anaerobranca gottschalkii]SES95449.1 hydrophobic/amphiphilic exporter-1, HAE1 family [Anaerobranca gottschalkii DSM 13577]